VWGRGRDTEVVEALGLPLDLTDTDNVRYGDGHMVQTLGKYAVCFCILALVRSCWICMCWG
jgi:hypothetical protein